MVKDFLKMQFYHFLEFFFANVLLFIWILQQKLQFLPIYIFFADSKSRAQER